MVKALLDREATEGTAQELSAVELKKRMDTLDSLGGRTLQSFIVVIAALMILGQLGLDAEQPRDERAHAGRHLDQQRHLVAQPIAFLQQLAAQQPSREATLQLALAWVDEMLLYPALEIKAPASVESVHLLSAILVHDPTYVPALYGRGLNYLHRPARLVWPEAQKTVPDAASHDLGLCVALGRKIGGGSPRLVSTLALALGDAYAKEGHHDRARSWWQIAQNASSDADVRAAIERRWGWTDGEVLDRLESELEGRMLDLEHPMTDLALMWR